MMTSLLPEDVPGAILRADVLLEDNSVLELKRWLECRGLPRTGTKSDLILRIENCIKAGNDKKIFLGVDGGKWYDAKNNLIQIPQNSSASQFSLDGIDFKPFNSLPIPQYFNKGHIYNYLIGDCVENDIIDCTTTVKPFKKGHQFVGSDHIENVLDGKKNNYYVLQCKCRASFQKTITYNVTVIINMTSGAVLKGICECKQSALGKCSHISALLIFLNDYVTNQENVACTSQPRKWGLGSQKKHPGAIETTVYPIKRFKPIARTNFDPRPESYVRTIDENDFISRLQKINDTAAFQTVLHLHYEDFMYDLEEVEVIKQQSLQYLENIEYFVSTNGNDNVVLIEGTFPQRTAQWMKWRTYFITASNTKIVCQLKSDAAKKNFLLRNLWKTTRPITTVAMRYGINNEDSAREKYKSMLPPHLNLVETGLIVNKKFPYFASSVDGIVKNGSQYDHIIEIKCPYVLEKCIDLSNFDSFLTTSQLNNFFLKKINGVIIIKRNHPYLYQIIMSLIVLEVQVCQLIIWNPLDLLKIEINITNYRDIVDEIIDVATKFYVNVYVPEMFCMRTVRDLTPIKINIV